LVKNRILSFLRPVVMILGLTLSILPILGYFYEKWAAARAKRRHTPPGKQVNIGAQGLHMVIQGEQHSGVTVILESGAGGYSLEWRDVQANIAQFARVVAYDRAGRGWSDAGVMPRLPQRIASELHVLLKHAGVQPPYILVGQSLGGFYVRQFAAMYPQEVAGLVLVDASHPEMHQYPEAGMDDIKIGLAKDALKTRLGWKRLRGIKPYGFYETLPISLKRAWVDLEPGNTDATISEILSVVDGIALPKNLGNLPLTVLTRTPSKSALSPIWQKLQADLATLSTNSTHLIAEKAGHNIHHDDPKLVVEAVRQIVMGLKQKSNGAMHKEKKEK
jgi:pimeloyl-ACP methyl ester carboxylesterase